MKFTSKPAHHQNAIRQLIYKKVVLLTGMLLFCGYAFAQNYSAINKRIDSLGRLGLPKSALEQVDNLEQLARADNNTAQQLRAVIYRMKFQSALEEAPLVNIIERLKLDIAKAGYPLKPVLQSLLGSMYWSYYKQNRYQFFNRTRLEKPGTDFTKWDLQTINLEIAHVFNASLIDHEKLQETLIDILHGDLTDETQSRYLRPTLYDLLAHRALDFFTAEEPELTRPKLPFTLTDPILFGDAKDFAALVIKTTDTTSNYYQAIKLLQQATRFHLKSPYSEAMADIDLYRLDFIHRANTTGFDNDQLYFKAISKIATQFAAKPISADAMVLQAKYFYQKDSLKLAYQYYNQAAKAFPGSIGSKNAIAGIQNLQQRQLSVIMEDVGIPGKPLLALLTFRNIKAARLMVYKVSATQMNELRLIPSDINQYRDGHTIYASDSVFRYLKRIKPVQNEVLKIEGINDYHEHKAEFKINAQPTGHYVIVMRDELSDERFLTNIASFKVCPLSYVTRRNEDDLVELRVLNRETGKPEPNVNITINEVTQLLSNANGACTFSMDKNKNFSVKLTTKKDTLYTPYRYVYGAYNNTINPVSTTLFTDRQIYRPGQIVYFKGIQLETIEGKSRIMAKENVTLNINDSNNKLIMSIPEITNEFGTFAGSFTVPQNILNGNIYLVTGNNSRKAIKVEEYKRPGFSVEFLPVKGNYKPNEIVTLTGKVKSYSGYGLSQAIVVYHIKRRGIAADYNRYNYAKYGTIYNHQNEIATDTVKTNDYGEFEIKFNAIPIAGVNLMDINYQYNITADATDGNAETRTANTQVKVGLNNVVVLALNPTHTIHPADSMVTVINNLNGVAQNGTLRVKIFALKQPGKLFKNRLWEIPDTRLMSKAEFQNNFPDYSNIDDGNDLNWPVLKQVADINLNTTEKQPAVLKFNALTGLPTGVYKLLISAKNAAGDTTSTYRLLSLLNKPAIPENWGYWVNPLQTTVIGGGTATFLVGSGETNTVLVEKYNGKKIVSSKWLSISKGNQETVKIDIAPNEKNITVQFLMVHNNRQYIKYQSITTVDKSNDLKIKFLTYRDKLQPGEKEQWKLQISAKDKAVQAEILASLYDASLDDITRPESWMGLVSQNRYYGQNLYGWNSNDLISQVNSNPLAYQPYYSFETNYRRYEALDMLGYNYYGGYNAAYRKAIQYNSGSAFEMRDMTTASASVISKDLEELRSTSVDQMLQGKVSGLNEVSIGYSSAVPIKIRGGGSLNYDEIRDPNTAIALRSNFNETAFFYPQLRTNQQGEVLIDFTIPQALTKWKFRAFAHTKELNTGYIESTVLTQKQLSINANLPRFLREGDTVTVSARLANLTTSALSGKVNLNLLNAINLQPVKLLLNPADAEQQFSIGANSTKAVSFRLVIPFGIDALTYRLTADASTFTDGEENTIPILTNRILVTESMPMMVRGGQTRNFSFTKLIDPESSTLKSKILTLEYTQNPAWYALQALPYMMEFPYECSEQIFSRYYANSLGANLVNKMPVIKQVFDRWKAANSNELLSNLEKNQELKATLIEETPWLRDALNESEQKKRVALLFDLNKMSYELKSNLDKLKQRQLPDGGFPWFGGDRSDQYITRHILEGFGQLYHLGIADKNNTVLQDIAAKAMKYMEDVLAADAEWQKKHDQYDSRSLSTAEIHTWYIESYFAGRVLSPTMTDLKANYLKQAEATWINKSLYEQGMIALTMLRNNKPAVGARIMASLIQRAQQTDDMGMYWGKNQLGYFWYQSPIKTQCLMIELYAEAGNTKAVEEMKIWLLRSKQTNNWKTTTATAAACYALLLKGDDWLADNGTSNITLGGKNILELKPDIKVELGTGYIKTSWSNEQIKPDMGNVSVTNSGNAISWGALHWQYLENLDKITPSATDIHLERKYFIQQQSDTGPVLVAVDATHQPKTGDMLKVVVYLKAGREFEYIQLKDMRPAGTEPVDILSSYKYQDGLYYYQITKDVATNFFISHLNKGSYVFEYRLRVAQPGNFSTGISTVQCMYAPEFNAHSEGKRIVIK